MLQTRYVRDQIYNTDKIYHRPDFSDITDQKYPRSDHRPDISQNKYITDRQDKSGQWEGEAATYMNIMHIIFS